ncbi:hypothetical protein GCM10010969_36050 [Saccharibacillus kuerlensis]|uniref:Uncharacterized protein n=1 Tax=Saccharibacillus kuerlensis TaxID=459527 RepID=A0ABQ2LBI5_9BACL|nr:glycosyl hydrolase 115 family protein [Saccharibacillus kuerlensis]GGO07533.1 hypothetical protein GCM10010969_36050 [Saccharibacillus kuerlensis]
MASSDRGSERSGYNLGTVLPGNGDKPFWEDDPEFDTPEKRGAQIGKVMQRQYDLVKKYVENPVCYAALYGEIAELYKEGHVRLPEETIRVWADNGYGCMVSRRRDQENLRIPSLPAAAENGLHGLYYHITFHDLQASNHLTMYTGSAEFLKKELETAFSAGADDYLLLNCGNIRLHVYPLDIVRVLWSEGQIDPPTHLRQFVMNYYSADYRSTGYDGLVELYQSYAEAALKSGPDADDIAGEQYYHHPARQIIGHWLQGKEHEPDRRLDWAVGTGTFAERIQRFERKLEPAAARWDAWLKRCDEVMDELDEPDRRRAADQLRIHGELHRSGSIGFYLLCRAYAEYRRQLTRRLSYWHRSRCGVIKKDWKR